MVIYCIIMLRGVDIMKEHSHNEHTHGDHSHHEHDDHSHHHGDFKAMFFRSLPLAIPILVLSPIMGVKLFFQFEFMYSDILVAILSTLLLLYGGKPFYQGAVDEFKSKAPGMMALVSLGISVSYLYSIYAVISRYLFHAHIMDFFFEFASLVLIMLLGHWIEMKAVGEAGNAQKALAELLPKQAHLVMDDGSVTMVDVNSLNIGDVVRVQAGESIPSDGTVTEGSSRVNESLLTGESKPVVRSVGDQVIGGSTNGDGILFVRVSETGEGSFISQVQNLISQAQNQPSQAEGMADKVAGYLFYIAVVVSIVSFVVWFVLGDLQTAVLYMVTTLVIACPHALGLAIPLVVARSTSLGASRGLLVKNREALELANKADIMVLDKTGTLTTGNFKVLKYWGDENVLALMAGIEAGSSHPIAQSIINYVDSLGIEASVFEDISIISGSGIRGLYEGAEYQLISLKAYGKELDLEVPVGATLSVLVKGDEYVGAIALGDELKSSSVNLMEALKAKGITPIMATGDNEDAAKEIAGVLGIDYYSNQSPSDKYDLVKRFKDEGKLVIMVGDGVNDAPSLALADVGVAIGAGTQVAMDSADIVLTQSDPGDISSFLQLASKTVRKMRENLVWGAGYNFIAIPLAAGLFVPIGISISPAVGAILMSASTVIVAINAVFLKLDNK